MKVLPAVLSALLCSSPFTDAAAATISNSVVPLINQVAEKEYPSWKYGPKLSAEIQTTLSQVDEKIRVCSFNIFFNDREDANYPKEYTMKARLPRIVTVINEINPDIIAVQECFKIHLEHLLPALEDVYDFYGDQTNADHQEVNGFFYRKDRFKVIQGETITILFPHEVPYPDCIMSNTATKLQLKDEKTETMFTVYNTHLEFGDTVIRQRQAEQLSEDIAKTAQETAVIICGDMNTFPNRLDVSFPTYEGNRILDMFKSAGLHDTWDKALVGHCGPLGTFTNDPKDSKPMAFKGEGSPGVVLDHILASKEFVSLVHATHPIKVDGRYASDHMPVTADLIRKIEK